MNIADVFASAKVKRDMIMSTFQTNLKRVFGGGFAGISEQGVAELKQQIDTYCQDISDLINGFNVDGDISVALKGSVKDAAFEFIVAIKELLVAYVDAMKVEKDDLQRAYDEYVQKTGEISQGVSGKAQEIRDAAKNVTL